jgi:hypothetical protein
MSGHSVPRPVDLAVQEVIATHEAEQRAHVALARAWRTPGAPTLALADAYAEARGAHDSAQRRLRAALSEETT